MHVFFFSFLYARSSAATTQDSGLQWSSSQLFFHLLLWTPLKPPFPSLLPPLSIPAVLWPQKGYASETSLRAALLFPPAGRGESGLGGWQAGISSKTYGLFLSINLISHLSRRRCWYVSGGSVPGWAALLPGSGLSCGRWQAGGQAGYSHCGQLNTSIVCGPSLTGWERRWGAGRAEWREVGGRRREGCTTVYLVRGKSERGKKQGLRLQRQLPRMLLCKSASLWLRAAKPSCSHFWPQLPCTRQPPSLPCPAFLSIFFCEYLPYLPPFSAPLPLPPSRSASPGCSCLPRCASRSPSASSSPACTAILPLSPFLSPGPSSSPIPFPFCLSLFPSPAPSPSGHPPSALHPLISSSCPLSQLCSAPLPPQPRSGSQRPGPATTGALSPAARGSPSPGRG